MSSQFETVNFHVRKYLLSMVTGEERTLPVIKCKYTTVKSTAVQLKKMGFGQWKVGHALAHTATKITRIE